MGLIAAGVAAAAGAVVVERRAVAEKIETPAYDVVTKHDGFEVRRYAPTIVAEVQVEGSARNASNAGFRLLADYIFGNNESRSEIAMTAPVAQKASSEKIAMTAPVAQTEATGEGTDRRWVIQFTMPSKYTMKTLPRPRDERVKIREMPEAYFAAVRFSGAPAHSTVETRMAKLEDAARAAGLEPTGTPTYARYDPPWVLPFMRRNEILLPIARVE